MNLFLHSLVRAVWSHPTAAHAALAYIDPNTGGMLIQALATGLAFFTGIALMFSRQSRMIVGKIRRSLHGAQDRKRTMTDDGQPDRVDRCDPT